MTPKMTDATTTLDKFSCTGLDLVGHNCGNENIPYLFHLLSTVVQWKDIFKMRIQLVLYLLHDFNFRQLHGPL
jgi:hypothetical protein